MLEIIWSKYWSYKLLVKCRRNYVINQDERDMDRERVKEETGQNKANKIIYIPFNFYYKITKT